MKRDRQNASETLAFHSSTTDEACLGESSIHADATPFIGVLGLAPIFVRPDVEIPSVNVALRATFWIPAFAGMTAFLTFLF